MTALPGTPDGTALHHLEAWAAALARDGAALTVTDTPAGDLRVDELSAAAAAGTPIVVALRDVDMTEAEAVAQRIGATVVATQRLVQGSIIAPAGVEPAVASAPVADARGARPLRVLLTANVDEGDVARAASAQLAVALESVHDAQLERLETAYWSLRRANARLTRDNLGRHDAAAASVVGRLSTELKATKDQLAIEVEVARRNDEYFQAARAKLDEPHHRAAERLYQMLRVLPGGQALSRRLLTRGR